MTAQLPTDAAALRELSRARLAQLETDQQRDFARALSRGRSPREAAIEAGYSERSAQTIGGRLRKHAGIAAAVEVLTAVASSEVTFSHEAACGLLEQALAVRVNDLVTRSAQTGQITGLREQLSTAQDLRVKHLRARVRSSSKGQRPRLVSLEIQLHSPVELIAQLAKLRNWTGDPAVDVAALSQTHVSAAPWEREAPLILAQVADHLLDEKQLRAFVRADGPGKVALLRSALEQLKAKAA